MWFAPRNLSASGVTLYADFVCVTDILVDAGKCTKSLQCCQCNLTDKHCHVVRLMAWGRLQGSWGMLMCGHNGACAPGERNQPAWRMTGKLQGFI